MRQIITVNDEYLQKLKNGEEVFIDFPSGLRGTRIHLIHERFFRQYLYGEPMESIDEFEAAGFTPEQCEGLRDLSMKYQINPSTLIEMSRLLTTPSFKDLMSNNTYGFKAEREIKDRLGL